MTAQTLPQELEKKLSEIERERIEQQAKDIAQKNKLPYVNAAVLPVELEALALIDEPQSHSAQISVISKTGKKVKIVMVNPENPKSKKIIENLTAKGYSVSVGVVSLYGIQKVWNKYKDIPQKTDEKIGTVSIDQGAISEIQKQIKNIADLKERLNAVSTTNLLEILLGGAIKVESSDIHLEPEEEKVRVRYRIDGILSDIVEVSLENYNKLLSRIKISSGLKLNIHNTPQDGRFSVVFGEKIIEVRTSVLPGAYGENTVMRILDPETVRQSIEDLGMSKENFALVKKLLQKTTGSILTTGPTGSGKTTTLYAFIRHVNEPGSKIITIEDPVEYHIEGISQTQVNPAKGYTFANGLRSIVRQDPDVILVGEIRDAETAEIAMQAALTGHLVFSTLHTNDAAGAIPRLIDLGVKPVMIAPALNAVMAQRLVRKLCDKCKKKKNIDPETMIVIKEVFENSSGKEKMPKLTEKTEIFYPEKCAECNFTGYRGRIGVFEIFLVDDDMEKMILNNPAISEVRGAAIKKGMVTMLQNGYLKVLEGITSVEEVRRVLG